jgi:archaellum component FlaC
MKTTEGQLEAAEAQMREAETMAESARKSAELSESTWRQDNLMLQQSMEKVTRLEAEIEKLKARDVERQDEIFGAFDAS